MQMSYWDNVDHRLFSQICNKIYRVLFDTAANQANKRVNNNQIIWELALLPLYICCHIGLRTVSLLKFNFMKDEPTNENIRAIGPTVQAGEAVKDRHIRKPYTWIRELWQSCIRIHLKTWEPNDVNIYWYLSKSDYYHWINISFSYLTTLNINLFAR